MVSRPRPVGPAAPAASDPPCGGQQAWVARVWRALPRPVPWAWVISGLVLTGVGFAGLDRWFYEQVSLRLNTEGIDRDFYHVSRLFWDVCRGAFGYGLAGIAIGISLLILDSGRSRAVLAGFLAVLLTALSANVVQRAVGRARPNRAESHLTFARPLAELVSRKGISFPSGEAATAMALAWVLGRLLPRWKGAFYAAGALAASARLVSGAHYLSDVAAGSVLGRLLSAWIFNLIRPGSNDAGRHRGPPAQIANEGG